MIKDIFVESDFKESLKKLSPMKKVHYGMLLEEWNSEREDCFLSADIYDDCFTVCKFKKEPDGVMVLLETKSI
jgi:hypothetical protein